MQQQQFIIEELNENGPIILAEIHTMSIHSYIIKTNNILHCTKKPDC